MHHDQNMFQHMLSEVHFHTVIFLIIFVFLISIFVALFLFFRRAISVRNIAFASLGPTSHGILAPLDLQPTQNGMQHRFSSGTSKPVETDTVLVIMDISGYTQFMTLSRFSLGHAQHIISELLAAVMEAMQPQLVPSKIEGDAVLSFSVDDPEEPRLKRDLGPAIMRMIRSFYAKRDELQSSSLCQCKACRNIQTLELKAFIHRGSVLRYLLKGFYELSGIAVIEIHRLLKNHINGERYIFATDAVLPSLHLPIECKMNHHIERYDNLGQIKGLIYQISIETLQNQQSVAKSATAGQKFRDLKEKLVRNINMIKQKKKPLS